LGTKVHGSGGKKIIKRHRKTVAFGKGVNARHEIRWGEIGGKKTKKRVNKGGNHELELPHRKTHEGKRHGPKGRGKEGRGSSGGGGSKRSARGWGQTDYGQGVTLPEH